MFTYIGCKRQYITLNATNLTPDYLSSLVPESVGNKSAYNLRNARNIIILQAHSQLYFKYFLPSLLYFENMRDLCHCLRI